MFKKFKKKKEQLIAIHALEERVKRLRREYNNILEYSQEYFSGMNNQFQYPNTSICQHERSAEQRLNKALEELRKTQRAYGIS